MQLQQRETIVQEPLKMTFMGPRRRVVAILLVSAVFVPALCFADCNETNPSAQQRCLAQEAREAQQQAAREQQEAQRQAQQEAMREQQEAQRQAQQEAMREQQEAQRQAQQEAMRQQQEAQREAQQEAMRQQQEAQRQAQQEAMRQQQQAQRQAQQEAAREQQQQAQRQAQQEAVRQQQQQTQRQAQQEATRQQQQQAQRQTQQESTRQQQQEVAHPSQQNAYRTPQQERTEELPSRKLQEYGSQQRVPGQSSSETTNRAQELREGGQTERRGSGLPTENPFVHHETTEPPKANPVVNANTREGADSNPFVHPSNTPAAPHHPAQLQETTFVKEKSGYMAVGTTSDGARVFVEERRLAGNASQVTAYKEAKSGETVARLFANGKVVTKGADFTSSGIIGGTRFIQYKSGLHSAYLADGKPLFSEKVRDITWPSGETQRVIQRTTMVPVLRGGDVPRRIPVVRYYTVQTVNNVEFAIYQPRPYAAAYFLNLYQPFVAQLTQALLCPSLCLPATAAFDSGAGGYTDPMDLVGDLAMTDGTDDDVSPEAPAPQEMLETAGNPDVADADLEANLPPPPPEMVAAEQAFQGDADQQTTELRNTAGELRQRAAQSGEAALSDNVTNAQFAPVSYTSAANASGPPALAPIHIPDYARAQLRKEARLIVALQQNERGFQVSEVAAAAYAKVFVFQAASPIDVTEAGSDSQCTLSGGDLIRFASIPAQTDAVVTVKVISSRAGHCGTGHALQLGVTDLQDMMNAFAERVEHEKMRIAACLAQNGVCART